MKKRKTIPRSQMFLVTTPLVEWFNKTVKACGLRQIDIATRAKVSQGDVSAFQCDKMTFIAPAKWDAMQAVLKDAGAPALPSELDPRKNAPDQKAMLKELKNYKERHKASWEAIAKACGVHETTLHGLNRGAVLDVRTAIKLEAGLKKLQDLPAQLIKEGFIDEVKPSPKTKPAKKTSIIETTRALPTALDLDLREFELIQRIRQHLPGAIMNGHKARV